MPMDERWKAVPGYEGLYEVSDQGRVRSVDRVVQCSDGKTKRYHGRLLSSHSTNQYGHQLTKLGTRRRALVHVLVAEAFLGPCPDGHEVRHLNGNPKDNRAVNLAYGTRSENQRDHYSYGGRHARGKLSAEEVRRIRDRLCRGEKQEQIAREFGISRAQVSAIKTKRCFDYID